MRNAASRFVFPVLAVSLTLGLSAAAQQTAGAVGHGLGNVAADAR